MIIGILGGTFDPPHRSHLIVATTVLNAGLADEVLIVPCLKHRFGKTPVGFIHRLAMCELLVEDHPKIKVSDIELSIDRPGYTLVLLQKLKAQFPEHDLRMIAGTDIYHQRYQWYQFDEIEKIAPVIYVGRQGEEDIGRPVLPAPPEISSKKIREELSRRVHVSDEKLPTSILEYIIKHNLYGFGNSKDTEK